MTLPTFDDVLDAATALEGQAVRTPVLEFPVLNDRLGARIFIKPEMFQRTGSFKFRGAYNRLSRLDTSEAKRGVIAWSSGNHAQGVAAAASMLGIDATIIMPKDAPALKIKRTQSFGARIIFYDRYTEDREAIGRALADETGAILVPSYDDPYIITGQGTAALELYHDAPTEIANLLVPVGGGGLTAGCVLASQGVSQNTSVFTVEPEHFDDHARSFKSGVRETADVSRTSLCDALLSPAPGEMTFAINRSGIAGGLVVTEAQVQTAIRFAFEELKLVIEPGGSVGLAALLAGILDPKGEPTALIASGGNVDPDLYATILTRS